MLVNYYQEYHNPNVNRRRVLCNAFAKGKLLKTPILMSDLLEVGVVTNHACE